MATQGERRRQAISAIRQIRAIYRKSDTIGEKVERELDRLIKRKTLITPDSLATLARLLEEYARQVERVINANADMATVVMGIPR